MRADPAGQVAVFGGAVQKIGAEGQHHQYRLAGCGGSRQQGADKGAALLTGGGLLHTRIGRRQCPQLLALVDDEHEARSVPSQPEQVNCQQQAVFALGQGGELSDERLAPEEQACIVLLERAEARVGGTIAVRCRLGRAAERAGEHDKTRPLVRWDRQRIGEQLGRLAGRTEPPGLDLAHGFRGAGNPAGELFLGQVEFAPALFEPLSE